MANQSEINQRIVRAIEMIAGQLGQLTERSEGHSASITELRGVTTELRRDNEEQQKLNRAVVKMMGDMDTRHRETLAEMRQDTAYTRRIWIAVAKKLELWDDLEEDGLT